MQVQIKRVYEAPSPDDGLRVLVDRPWPRGVKKGDAAVDIWAKELAPSAELRKWFAHQASTAMQEYLTGRPETELSKEIRLRLSHLGIALGRNDLAA